MLKGLPMSRTATKSASKSTKPAKAEKPTASAAGIIVDMTYAKETPGTFVFQSVNPDAAVTQLYVRKSGMKTASKSLTLKLTV